MKKIIRLTESDLTRIVKRAINESDRAYGHEEISKLYSGLKDDEDVSLDDSSGELSGQVVTKIEYVKNMLGKAIQSEDWDTVKRAMNYLSVKF
jgi:predicted phosphatase